MHIELDEVDIRILRLLQHDSRMTNKELGDKLGRSLTVVHDRVRKLEEKNVIVRHVALLNRELIGKGLMVFTTVYLKEHSKGALNDFGAATSRLLEVMECYNLTGEADFLLKIVVADMDEYNDFLKSKLATLPNIRQLQSSPVLSASKIETAYPLIETAGKKKSGK